MCELTIEDLRPIAEEIDADVPALHADGFYIFTAEELVEFTNKAIRLAEESSAG